MKLLFLLLSYLIAQGICYLCLCEASFPKKLVFAYLEDLHNEFFDQYGKRVPTVTRPYFFIEFGKIKNLLFVQISLGLYQLYAMQHLVQTFTSRRQRRSTLTARQGGT